MHLHQLRITRRTALWGATGTGLAWAWPTLSPRAAESRGTERPKSFILIWLSGGPSQLETWDPHPGTLIGGPTTGIPTSIAGVQIAADFPRIAAQLQQWSVIRSLVSKEGDHERGAYTVRTGYRPDPTTVHPALGAIAFHELPDPRVEIPQFVSLGDQPFPSRGGYLGERYDPYRVFAPGDKGENLRPHVEGTRQARRLAALESMTRQFAKGRTERVAATLHQHTVDEALKMMHSDQLKAFDLQHESLTTKAMYGEHPFGLSCLIARRLIETGVRAVEVTLGGFDTHADNFTGHRLRAAILDPAVSTLVQELAERELLASTVVLVIGEFGRTPRINTLEGRDHWPSGFSCLLTGGGLRSGQCIGATDPTGERKDPADPVTISDLTATILQTLGIDFTRELVTPIGRPLKLSEGIPISRLIV